jgi:hypothetical protein
VWFIFLAPKDVLPHLHLISNFEVVNGKCESYMELMTNTKPTKKRKLAIIQQNELVEESRYEAEEHYLKGRQSFSALHETANSQKAMGSQKPCLIDIVESKSKKNKLIVEKPVEKPIENASKKIAVSEILVNTIALVQ